MITCLLSWRKFCQPFKIITGTVAPMEVPTVWWGPKIAPDTHVATNVV